VQHPGDWLLFDALHQPARQRDMPGWQEALQILDAEVFMPLSQRLRARTITHLTIVSPGDTTLASFDISPAPRWQIWRRRADKIALCAALGSPA
jgi:hypothetical protein